MADVLKEFLVSLGFKTDEAGLRRFTQQLQSTHHVVRDFAVAVGAMAVGAEEAIRRTAKQFENLFYLSQQTGVAVNTIKGLESAFRQVGLSAGEADAAIAGLDTLFRDMPGMRQFAKSFTGTDAPDQVILRLAKQYKDILAITDEGRRQAAEAQFRSGRAAPLGLDPTTILRAAQNLEAALQGKRFQERLAKAFGIDPQQAAADATELERIFNEMWATIKTGADTLIVTTFPALRKLLEDFTKWLSTEGAAHVKRWGDNLNKFLNDPELLPAIERAFKNIGTAIGEIVTGIENWIGKEGGLEKTKMVLIDIATTTERIVTAIKWVVDHWALAGQLLGEIATNQHAGEPEIPEEQKRRMRERGLRVPESQQLTPGSPYPSGSDFSPTEALRNFGGAIQDIGRWISGVKNTPWVKIETTDKPLIIDFASQVYERLMVVLGINTTTPGAAASGAGGSGGAGAMGYRPAGRFGGAAPSRTRPTGFNPGASGPGVTSLSEMVKLAKQAGFSDQDAPVIASIAMAESSGKLGAVGGVGELGLTQINPHAWGEKLANLAASSPLGSFQAAKQVLDKQGWQAWSAYTKGTYREHLGAAMGQKPPDGHEIEHGDQSVGLASRLANFVRRTGVFGSPEEAGKNLVTVKSSTGQEWRVHKMAAPAFQGFLNTLEKMGYHPTSSGGYSNRSIRGGGGASAHAYGAAIDIDAAHNPLGSHATNLPKNVAEMAAKFGLIWGGDWKNRPDPMHFEWAGGRPLGSDRTDRNVNVDSDHKVEINVHGTTDAHGTARAVRDAQDRHSALHARNLRTAIA